VVEDLQRRLGTKVRLDDRGGKGTLEIDFFSYEDLERILALLRRERGAQGTRAAARCSSVIPGFLPRTQNEEPDDGGAEARGGKRGGSRW
jgi:hypothetical protein